MIGRSDKTRRATALSRGLGAAAALLLLAPAASAASGGNLENIASVTHNGGTTNLSTAITQIKIRTDLGVTASASPDPIFAGTEFTVTLQVENFGPSNSNGFSVELQTSDDVSFVSSPDNCTLDTGGAVCGLGSLPVGDTAEFSILWSFLESLTGPIVVDVRVFPDNIDSVADNDVVVLSIPIDPAFFLDGFEDGTTDAWSNTVSDP
ncbi:MAG: CARDB domain-containing protein [Acidobacteriota bacterium]